MAVAGPVVGEHALLGGRLDILEPRADVALGVADVLRLGERGRALEDVEGGPRVAAGERHEVIEGRRRDSATPPVGPSEPASPRSGSAMRPADDARDLVVGQRLEPPDAHPRQERGVDLEVRVLGRRADEGDGPVLDVRQQGVLLGLVEAVDLVEEQQRSGSPCRASRSWASAIVARTSATPDMTADSDVKWAPISAASSRARLVLPVPGGPHSRSDDEMPAGDAPAERAALADEVVLADELGEVAWTHPRGERLPLGRRLEEGFGPGAGRSPGGWHGRMVARPGGRPARSKG